MAWNFNAATIHATVGPHSILYMYVSVYVCASELFQGCIILFKETEAVKVALPQNWMKEAHIHTSSEKAIFMLCVSAQLTAPLQHDTHNLLPWNKFLQLLY